MKETSDIAWAKLPVDIRIRAVARLQAAMDPEFFEEVKRLAEEKGLDEWLPLGWHFGQGMAIRNLLRSNADLLPEIQKSATPIRDAELPPFDEYYGKDTDVRNWDDYYVQCVEAAAGLREIE